MSKLKSLIFILSVFSIFSLRAQSQSSRPANSDAQQNAADTTGAANATNANQKTDTGKPGSATDAGAIHTAIVPQTTTSQSGSPAVLSGNNGAQRDGTNNVQRATMNMAGSPAENLKVDNNKPVSTQKRTANTKGNTSAGQSGQINDKTRKENNALSDQNNSSKDKKASAVDKQKKKLTKKSRRKKSRA